jgi:DNA-binding phage protein
MVLTKQFQETVKVRAQRDLKFRQAMLVEAVNNFLAGDVGLAKHILRNYINATESFTRVAKALEKNPKSIQRMLGPQGNPSTQSLFQIIVFLQKKEGIHLETRIAK